MVWKDSHTLICLPHAVSFGMQTKSNHLIRQIEDPTSKIAPFCRIFSNAELHFSWDGRSMCYLISAKWHIVSVCLCSSLQLVIKNTLLHRHLHEGNGKTPTWADRCTNHQLGSRYFDDAACGWGGGLWCRWHEHTRHERSDGSCNF